MYDLKNYTEVKDRIPLLFEKYQEARVITEIISYDAEANSVVMRASIYRDHETENALATGHAEEHQSNKGANKDCWVENCETSAIGRALANCGLGGSGPRPSKEEMEKVERHEGRKSLDDAYDNDGSGFDF